MFTISRNEICFKVLLVNQTPQLQIPNFQQWLESTTVLIYCLSSQSGRVNVRALPQNQFETNLKYHTVKRPEPVRDGDVKMTHVVTKTNDLARNSRTLMFALRMIYICTIYRVTTLRVPPFRSHILYHFTGTLKHVTLYCFHP